MTNDTLMLTIAIMGAIITWTASVVSLVIWLTGKFRGIEVLLYREMNKRDERASSFHDRLMILELRVLGVTHSGK